MLLTHLLWSRRSRVSLVTGGLHSSRRGPGPAWSSSRVPASQTSPTPVGLIHRLQGTRRTGQDYRATRHTQKSDRRPARTREATRPQAQEKRTIRRSSAPAIGPARSSTSGPGVPPEPPHRSRARSHTTATSHSTATTRSIEKNAYHWGGMPRSGTDVAAMVSHTATKFSASARSEEHTSELQS